MFFPFFDSTFILLIPAIVLAIYAQIKIRSAYAKYSKYGTRIRMTGAQVARELLTQNGLRHVEVEPVPGNLTDHYDPREQTLRLSEEVYRSTSIAALGVAAHETGHAIQHGTSYYPLMLRNSFVPVVNFGSSLALPVFFIGLIFVHSTLMMDIGIVLYTAAVAFHMVTLPVELNASRRAIGLLSSQGYLSAEEVGPAKKVLNAAAWTYVAATAMAVMTLIRLLVLRGGDED